MQNGIAAWAVAAVLIVYTAVFLTAIVTCLGSGRLSGGGKVGWMIAILALPVIGPVIWLFVGRRSSPSAT
ncbi:PLDc N-terminal domain-containing protein [Rhodococcus erythropolis]|uniref:PLDc N-terminal domain-containing protein n=1 Tax=Rhodococcus erythropolis TaxID=1833 RepID=UPI0035AF612E